jgi:hypothetical protein
MSSAAAGASKLSYWDVAKHATEQYDKNYKQLKGDCELAFSKKADWENHAKALTRKTHVVGESFLSTKEYAEEAAIYSGLEKSQKLALEILETLGRAISVCTRPPISADDYETLRGIGYDVQEITDAASALGKRVKDLEQKQIDVKVICEAFAERLHKAKDALNALYYYQEGKVAPGIAATVAGAVGSRVVAVGSAIGGLFWGGGTSAESVAQAVGEPAGPAPAAAGQLQKSELGDDAVQPGATPAAPQALPPADGPAGAVIKTFEHVSTQGSGQGGAGRAKRPPAPPRQGQGGGTAGSAAASGKVD